MSEINQLAQELAKALTARGSRMVTAESCTGGLLAAELTRIPGSSSWFEGAFVTYRLSAKTGMLGIPASSLARHGAVSEPTARAMAEAALGRTEADFSVAITGIAGPDGGEPLIPVGTVWFAWAAREPEAPTYVAVAEHHLPGSRDEVRAGAALVAVNGMLQLIRNQPPRHAGADQPASEP